MTSIQHLFIEEVQKQAELLSTLHFHTRNPSADYVERKPVGSGQSVDYMGHAAVTDALLAHDPLWTWEPLAVDDQGLPVVLRDKEGRPRAMWARLTVHGHTRIGVGTCEPNARDPYKELIGDFIRNAAMRFGVGLSLWSKSEWADEPKPTLSPGPRLPETGEGGESVSPDPPSPTRNQQGTDQKQLNSIMAKCREMGLPDDLRHEMITLLTNKRTVHVSHLTPDEAGKFHLWLHSLRARRIPDELMADSGIQEGITAWLNRPSPI